MREKYGSTIDKAVQSVYDEGEAVEDILYGLRRVGEEYTPKNHGFEEHELEDKLYEMYDLHEDEERKNVRTYYAIEDTVAYIFQKRLDWQEGSD
jgi:hypothetical protein